MLAMTMTMRLAAGDDEALYGRFKKSAIKLMDEAPPLVLDVPLVFQ